MFSAFMLSGNRRESLSISAAQVWHPVFMKNKSHRELEKHWAQEAAKKAKPAKKKTLTRKDRNQAAIKKAQQAGSTQEPAQE